MENGHIPGIGIIIKNRQKKREILNRKYEKKELNCIGFRYTIIENVKDVDNGIYLYVVFYNDLNQGLQVLKCPGGSSESYEKPEENMKNKWKIETGREILKMKPISFVDDEGHIKVSFLITEDKSGERILRENNMTSPACWINLKNVFSEGVIISRYHKFSIRMTLKYLVLNNKSFRITYQKYNYDKIIKL